MKTEIQMLAEVNKEFGLVWDEAQAKKLEALLEQREIKLGVKK